MHAQAAQIELPFANTMHERYATAAMEAKAKLFKPNMASMPGLDVATILLDQIVQVF